MNESQYMASLESYVSKLISHINIIKKLPTPYFNSIEIDCNHIESSFTELENNLSQKGLNPDTSVLYYIEITTKDKKSHLVKTVAKRKKTKRNSSKFLALPKINTYDEESSILYVGKTNKNFLNRFKQHLGLASPTTYALHLNRWACDLDLHLVLHYALLKLTDNELPYLEQLETALHESLKPIFGRSAH
jgi:hypothetical protein